MTNPTPAPHPFLHPDVLPNILSYCTDPTLAHLMLVSRHVLSEIVNLRWPIITLEPSNRHPPIHSRTSLPENPRWFSSAMVGVLAQYARIVRITPHAFYLCPPKMIWGDKGSMTRTLIIDRKGLCRSGALNIGKGSETPNNNNNILSECEISRLFTPTTLRIDNINQHPIFPIPCGLRLAPSLVRLVLIITPGQAPSSSTHKPIELDWLHKVLPDHIVDISFVFRIPMSHGNGFSRQHLFALSLPDLAHSISCWMEPMGGATKDRKWTVIGSEELDAVTLLPKRIKGQAKESIPAILKREIGNELKSAGRDIAIMGRVTFMTLADYAQNTSTRSELSMEEIYEIQDNVAKRACERRQAKIIKANKSVKMDRND